VTLVALFVAKETSLNEVTKGQYIQEIKGII